MNKKFSVMASAGAGILMLSTAGCYVERDHPRREVVVEHREPARTVYVEEDDSRYGDVTATEAPPAGPPAGAVIVEPGPPPEPDVVWVGGVWVWSGGHYHWSDAHWARRPHAGAVWEAPRWERGGHGWVRARGHWR